MITEFCTPVKLRFCCQTERIWNIWKLTEGDSAPKIKEVEQKKKVLLYSRYFCVKKKNISALTQSVGVTDVESEIDLILARASMFIAPDDISRMAIRPAHRSSLGVRCYLKLQNQLLLLKLWP